MVKSVAIRSLGTSEVKNDRIADAKPLPKLYITMTKSVSKNPWNGRQAAEEAYEVEDVHVMNTGGNGASPMANVERERIKTEPLARAKLAVGAWPFLCISHALMAGRTTRKMKIWVAAWMERR